MNKVKREDIAKMMACIIFCLISLTSSIAESSLVFTTTGPVFGKFNDVDNVKYLSYEGIPYAESPVGELRFQPPVPVKPWSHVLYATSPAPVCPQEEKLYKYSEMSEDCLYLNIYTPYVPQWTASPVMVFIHGGYFIWGSGNREPMLGPENVLSTNTVVVTLNYRLGALGFLSLGIKEASGNAGLKDILLALRWIRDNIPSFGGDPNRITLAGVEAGAMLTHYLMLTDKSLNLFHNVMLLTGNALSYRALQRNPRNIALKLSSMLGIKYKNDHDLLQELKQASAFQLIQVQIAMIYDAPDVAFVLNDQFMPCLEENTSIAIITSDPIVAMKTGYIQNLPTFIGFNNQDGDEMLPLINNHNIKEYPNRIRYLNENFDACIPRDITYPPGSQMRGDLANSIRDFYFNGGNIDMFNAHNFINLITDTAYGYAADKYVQLLKHLPNSAVYYYLLNMDSDIYWFKVFENITYPGGSHFDSLFFVQPITKSRLADLDSRKRTMLKDLKSYMSNFIAYGNPTPPGIYNDATEWVDAGTARTYMSLGDSPVLIWHPPCHERLNFWHKVYDQHYQYIKNNTLLRDYRRKPLKS